MQALESYDNLDLFQSSHRFNSSPVLDKGISLINSMVELDYITYGNKGLEFTDAGIKYMLKKWDDDKAVMTNSNVDFSFAYALNGSDPNGKKSGHHMLNEFKTKNLMIDVQNDEVDYNNAVFKKEYDAMEPGVDDVEKVNGVGDFIL